MSQKPLVIFIDDEPEVTGRFKLRHGGILSTVEIDVLRKPKEYKRLTQAEKDKFEKMKSNTASCVDDKDEFCVETFNNTDEFMKRLRKLKNDNINPDLILIDLSFELENVDPIELSEYNKEKEKFKATFREIDKKHHNFYEDRGYQLLSEARNKFRDVPIAIYTAFGLLCANNEDLESFKKNNAELIIKTSTHSYESIRIPQLIESYKAKKHNEDEEKLLKSQKLKIKIFVAVPLIVILFLIYLMTIDDDKLRGLVMFFLTILSMVYATFVEWIAERMKVWTMKIAKFFNK